MGVGLGTRGQFHQTAAIDGKAGRRSARLKSAVVASTQSAFFPRGFVTKITNRIGAENVHDETHRVFFLGFLFGQEGNPVEPTLLGLLNVTPAHGLVQPPAAAAAAATRELAFAWGPGRLLQAERRRRLLPRCPLAPPRRPQQRRRRSLALSFGGCLSCVFCAVPPVRRGPEPELRAKLSRFRRC